MKGKRILLIIVIILIAAAGFSIGRLSGNPAAVPEKIKRAFPALPVPPKNTPWKNETAGEQTVIIEVPAENAVVGDSIDVSGRFLNDGRKLTVNLKDGAGQLLRQTAAKVTAAAGDEFGRFQATVAVPTAVGAGGTSGSVPAGNLVIEVMSVAPDGTVSGPDAARTVSLARAISQEVEVFFMNNRLDPAITCVQAFPVKRTVLPGDDIRRAALEELLRGPTAAEAGDGYSTSLPVGTGVKLLSVTIDGQGRVSADFSRELDQGVAGSCRVNAIRTQITATLKQFAEVKAVVISVEGDAETSLQP